MNRFMPLLLLNTRGFALSWGLPTLNNIKKACHADEYGVNVLQVWLEQKDLVEGMGGPTWNRLIQALLANSLKLYSHVQRIQDGVRRE